MRLEAPVVPLEFSVTIRAILSCETPPDIGVKWRSDYISGIGRRGDGFVIIFDLARLFSAEATAFLGATGAPPQNQPSGLEAA